MRNKILIYCDYGCADIGNLQKGLSDYFQNYGIEIATTDAAEIISGHSLNDKVLAFFMPGGASTPYRQKLSRYGNEAIVDYVKNGGLYFGICAGAYYACRDISFEADIPELHLERDGIGLIEGRAVGTLYKEFGLAPYSLTAASAAVTKIKWLEDEQLHSTFYHGGPYFELGHNEDCKVLAVYEETEPKFPAIVMKNVGQGKVIASGVHFEDTGESLQKTIHALRIDHRLASQNAKKLAEEEVSRRALFDKLMQKVIG